MRLAIATCRSCEAEIVWALTEHGRKIPLDAQPAENGTFALSIPPDGGDPGAIHAPKVAAPGPRYLSHFATCPNAAEHRRSQKRAE